MDVLIRYRSLRSHFETSPVYLSLSRSSLAIRESVLNSKDPVVASLVASVSSVSSSVNSSVKRVKDKVEEVREVFETSQDPLVWKVRDWVDRVWGESETGKSVGEIRKKDADFNVPDMLEEMEEYMIPIVVKGFLQGNVELMKEVMEEDAMRWVMADFKRMISLGIVRDDKILELDHVEFLGGDFIGKIPILKISFRCQHVVCEKNMKGEIVRGSESNIQIYFYTWTLRRDYESQDFNWKIIDMKNQEIAGLL